MTKELFIKLCEELGRDPTDDEMADAQGQLIDNAMLERDDQLFGEPT